MRNRRVAAVTLNQIPFAWEHNRRNIMGALEAAHKAGATYVCLPELCITGYECEDNFTRSHIQITAMRLAVKIAAEAPEGLIFNLGLPVEVEGRLYNCSALVVNRQIVGVTAKRFLAGDGVYYEQRQFKPWPLGKVSTVLIDGRDVPIGDISYRIGNRRIGFDHLGLEICEEAWTGERQGGRLKDQGVEIIFNPSGSHYARGKYEIRHRLLQDGSRAADAVVAFSNLHGCNGSLTFDGGATILDRGDVRARGKRFSQAGFTLVWVDVDLALVTGSRCRTGSFHPNPEETPANRVVVADFDFPTMVPSAPSEVFVPEAWETGPHFDVEESCREKALAYRDWLSKAKRWGIALPLSGGRDSALAACIVKVMVDLGVAELGLEEFKSYFTHFKAIEGCTTNKELIGKLLFTFYEGADNIRLPGEKVSKKLSSKKTEKAARVLAQALGADYLKFPIGAIVNLVLAVIYRVIAKRLGRPLNWKDDGITLQNVQARVRAIIAWFLANLEHRLLLTTSNRTEGATGYWTAGGDGEGGLAPNSGTSKQFISLILYVLQNFGLQGVDRLPELKLITGMEATAELLPQEMMQKDEDELGPFAVLDAIEIESLENQRSPLECLLELQAKMQEYSLQQLGTWVNRWFTLWFRNQWKRVQMAAGLHSERHNVDPRTGRREPIISGGFEQELAEMREYVERDVAA